MRRRPLAPGRDSLVGRIALEGRVVHIPDILADSEYDQPEAAKLGRWRTMIGVPLLREGTPIGALTLTRSVVRPFTDKQIELLTTFADQAVIAIENVRLFDAEQQRTRELTESLEYRTATADILRVISSSPTDVQPVFDTIAESAVRLCDGQFSFVLRFDGDLLHFASCHGLSAEGLEVFQRLLPRPAGEETISGRAILRHAVAQVPDVQADSAYGTLGLAQAVNYRSIVAVPLLRDGDPIGTIAVARANAGMFPKRQIALLQTFADQAVIAIENVRLFDEVQARTTELSGALERQTATSEVLQVISSSPGELEPMFQSMLANATRICRAEFGNMFLCEGVSFRAVAVHGPASEWYRREPLLDPVVLRNTPLARVGESREVLHLLDLREDQSYLERNPRIVSLAESAGARTILGVPMVKEDRLIGAIFIYRLEVRPFTDKEIELVTNFAAQAVIAIENVRLLNELRESLQQQTATAGVLEVISSSPGDMKPVFESMLANALRICDAKFGHILLYDGEKYHAAHLHDVPPLYREFWKQ